MAIKLLTRAMVRPLTALALVATIGGGVAAQGRTLSWPAVTVEARLGADGRLVVRERQQLLFTGDWNGGERRFDVRSGQGFTLTGIARVDSANGALHPLIEEAIDEVDGYDVKGGRTVRWRSRLPSDPPFDHARRTYVLDAVFEDILQVVGDSVVLDHDFAFSDRQADIDTFRLTLTIDPTWALPAGFTGRYEQLHLAPGNGFVVSLPVRWRGSGPPPGVFFGARASTRGALAVLAIAGLLILLVRFTTQERTARRFAPLTPMGAITPAWIQEHVLTMLPEVVGAAWDGATGQAEVAATLARLVVEGKLASKVEVKQVWIFSQSVLHLKLMVKRDQFQGHERTLIDGLFRANATETDTDAVRERYKSSGFDPAARIRDALERRVDAAAGREGKLPRWTRWLTAALLAVAVGCLVTGVVQHPDDTVVVVFGCLAAALAFGVATSQALLWRWRVEHPLPHLLRVVMPLAAAALTLVFALRLELPLELPVVGTFTWAGLTILLLAISQSVLTRARTRESVDRILMRKRLASARRWFRRELATATPALQDAWYPYLIAMGLGPVMDHWFRAFGGAVASTDDWQSSGATSSSMGSAAGGGSSPGSSWTGFGGGGGFSGGGSGETFSSAVGGMASAISAPSSSSSSGSSSSAGGSSGGGGGGGW